MLKKFTRTKSKEYELYLKMAAASSTKFYKRLELLYERQKCAKIFQKISNFHEPNRIIRVVPISFFLTKILIMRLLNKWMPLLILGFLIFYVSPASCQIMVRTHSADPWKPYNKHQKPHQLKHAWRAGRIGTPIVSSKGYLAKGPKARSVVRGNTKGATKQNRIRTNKNYFLKGPKFKNRKYFHRP